VGGFERQTELKSGVNARPIDGRYAPIIAAQTSGAVSPKRSLTDAAANGWVGWIAARQLSGDEPAEADVYSFYQRPSTMCVARSVAVDFITR
jgi:hypothetical protein